jgi:hypothetical protein
MMEKRTLRRLAYYSTKNWITGFLWLDKLKSTKNACLISHQVADDCIPEFDLFLILWVHMGWFHFYSWMAQKHFFGACLHNCFTFLIQVQ